jgi:thiol-disulfide isomerase/thioredoxin
VKAFMEEYRAADENRRPALLADPQREPRHRFTPIFLAEAERLKGTPEALPYWAWLVENGSIVDPKAGDRAVERIFADHLADPGLAPAAKALGRAAGVRGAERTIPELTRIIDASIHPAVRAEALFQRALLRRQAGSPDARKDFERAAVEAPDSPAGKKATEQLAASVPLAIGVRAPELDGQTLASSAVKLSSFKGRVVLVDFWGMWCGPCVAQLPQLKKLREKLRGKPFELIGVNSDKDRDALARFLAANHVDWTNVIDGGLVGPAAIAWRVDSWPTYFIVDSGGVIRARDLPAGALEKQITGMLPKK